MQQDNTQLLKAENKKSKIIKRLCIFFLGIPVVIALIFCNFINHLPLNLAVCVFSILATFELYNIMHNKNPDTLQNKKLLVVLSGIVPVSAVILSCIRLEGDWIDHCNYIFIAMILVALAFEVLSQEDFSESIPRLANSAFIIFYSGYLITFITRLTVIENSTYFITLFFLMVFLCDSSAWFFGMTMGKSTRGWIKASPNKSLVGFLGGFVGSVGIGIIAALVYPEIFDKTWKLCAMGILIGFSSIFGDLVESVIKRSGQTKDSGTLILGRGGVLDSIDSIIFSAPVFYIAWHFLYDFF